MTFQEDLAQLQGQYDALSTTFRAVAAQQQARANQLIGLEATIAYVRGRIADDANEAARTIEAAAEG